MIRHVVVDRDGVLNREGPAPLADSADWVWEDGALAGLRLLADAGVVVSVVTNQSAVARGTVTAGELEGLHAWLGEQLTGRGVVVVGIFACPHDDADDCGCRKPRPGLVYEAVDRSGIGHESTLLIGDARRDLDAARSAGVGAVLVRTGKGEATAADAGPDVAVADDLRDAVERFVLRRTTGDAPKDFRDHPLS